MTDVMHCSLCLFAGTPMAVVEHQAKAHPGPWPANPGPGLLARTQAALAASQADLSRLERERDGVRQALTWQAAKAEDLRGTLAMRTGQLAAARIEIDHLKAELRHALALLPADPPQRLT